MLVARHPQILQPANIRPELDRVPALGPRPVVYRLEFLHSLNQRTVAVVIKPVSEVEAILPLNGKVGHVVGCRVGRNVQANGSGLRCKIAIHERCNIDSLLVPAESKVHQEIWPEGVIEAERVALWARIPGSGVPDAQLRTTDRPAEQSWSALMKLREGIAIEEAQLVAEEIVGTNVDGVAVIYV